MGFWRAGRKGTLRKAFDTDGDGKRSGTETADFGVRAANVNCVTTVRGLAYFGDARENLTMDMDNIILADGRNMTDLSSVAVDGVSSQKSTGLAYVLCSNT